MKKLLWLVLVSLLVSSFFVTSCSSSSSSTTNQITVATDATWAPFEYVDEKTKAIVGFDIDVMNAIAENQNIKVTYKNVAFDPLLAGMAQGMYDAAISSITINDERKKSMLFSDPYFTAGQMVVVKVDNTKIKGMETLEGTVGAQIGTTGATEVGKVKAASLKTYDDIGLAFQDLINGQTQAVVCDNPVAMGYVSKNSTKIKSVGGLYTTEDYGIAIAKGKTDLQKRINEGIKTIKSNGKIGQISKKWLEAAQ
jgi:polar amino acid transport system substrate-binding protein